MVQEDHVSETDITIRFKNGRHTIFLLVDPLTKFHAISQQLLDILQDRYSDGLETLPGLPKTAIPDDATQLEFAVPKSTTDPSQGWKPLKIGSDDTPVDKQIKDGMMLAFAFQTEDAEEAVFEVEFPSYDDEVQDEAT